VRNENRARPDGIEVAEPLELVRIFADADGASHFADDSLPFELIDFAPPAPPVSVSTVMEAESVFIASSPPGWFGDWHPAPHRQMMFVLDGRLEVEVADGEVRVFGPGDVALVEDTAGQGHVTRVIGDRRAYLATVPLREGDQ
jgi:mannose-6-phosphate isomerase-like protein (cupin superfamily)